MKQERGKHYSLFQLKVNKIIIQAKKSVTPPTFHNFKEIKNKDYRGVKNKTPPLRSKSANFENTVLFLPKNLRIQVVLPKFWRISGPVLTIFFSRFPLAIRSKTLKIFWRASRANFKFSARGFIFAKNLMNFWRGGFVFGGGGF